MAQVKIQSALIMTECGAATVVNDLAIPSAEYRQVLIKVHSVGLNTPDILALDYLGRPGAGMGFDFAGEVVELGENVPESCEIGDRVAGFVHGCHAANYSLGSFREFLLADADLLFHIPDDLSYSRASTLGMGISTAAQALYQSLSLPLPDDTPKTESKTLLIYGASTATGAVALQLAKLSGIRVIATCSQKHSSWISSLGADEVVDYRDPNAILKIRVLGERNGIFHVMDCVSKKETAQFCYQCFSEPPATVGNFQNPVYASLMPVEDLPDQPKGISTKVHSTWNMVYTCFGRRFTLINDEVKIRKTWEPSKRDRDFMTTFYRLAESHLGRGSLQPMPIEMREGGLEMIPDGITALRNGHANGKKLVYNIQKSE